MSLRQPQRDPRVARSPRPTVDLDAVYEVEVDGRSIPALFIVDPPEISVNGILYQIVSRQHALVKHHPGTNELDLTAMKGDVLIHRRSKGATPVWQLVKNGNRQQYYLLLRYNYLHRTQASPSDVQRRDGV